MPYDFVFVKRFSSEITVAEQRNIFFKIKVTYQRQVIPFYYIFKNYIKTLYLRAGILIASFPSLSSSNEDHHS